MNGSSGKSSLWCTAIVLNGLLLHGCNGSITPTEVDLNLTAEVDVFEGRDFPGPTEDDYAIPEDRGVSEKSLEFARTFEKYEMLAEGIKKCTSLQLYEGLPHQTWEQKLFKSELESKGTVEINGSHYYARPIQVDRFDASKLTRLVCSRESFVPFQGGKACGGYHADWCLKWTSENIDIVVAFCFGCGEIEASYGDSMLLVCDMWDDSLFETILDCYRTYRPTPMK